MRTLKNMCLAVVAFSLLAIPAAAQGKRGTRDNNGTNEPHGQARAKEVQTANKKGVNTKSKGSQNEGQHKHKGWLKRGKHEAKGHS